MKILVKLYPIVLIAVFILVFSLSARMSNPFINSYFTYPISESPYPKSWMKVAAFSEENAYLTDLENVEKLKATHPNVSFLLPKEKETYFKEKLLEDVREANHKNSSDIIVEQVAENKQHIELRIFGSKSSGFTKYEATDREIFPLAYTELNLVSAFYLAIVGIISGIVGCLIFNFFFKKYVQTRANLN